MKPITTATRVRRLKKLRDFIATVPPNKFDMSTWCEVPEKKVPEDGLMKVSQLRDGSCGTVACLAGYAAVVFSKPNEVMFLDPSGWNNPYFMKAQETIEDRAQNVLGLESDVAYGLFHGDWLNSIKGRITKGKVKKQALKVLDALIANKGDSIPEKFMHSVV